MKYKVLITGKNKSVMDDFFTGMTDNFDVLSSSTRYMDLLQHINYIRPDAFVYCANQESVETYNQTSGIRFRLSELGIPFVLLGSRGDCEEFLRNSAKAPDLILHRPLSASAILEKMTRFLDERAAVKEREERAREAEEAKQKILSFEEIEALTAVEEPARRKHILVVDDDPMMLKLIKEQLHDDYDVATAISGKIAMKFLERKETDLILLDYEMPEENGPAVLEKLRFKKATRDIPVVFLTGVTERDKITEALALKPQGYLLKPLDRGQLLDTIVKNIG